MKEGGLKLAQLHSLIAVSTGGPLRATFSLQPHPPPLPALWLSLRAQAFTHHEACQDRALQNLTVSEDWPDIPLQRRNNPSVIIF